MQLISGNQMTGQQTQREVGVENYPDGDATTNTLPVKAGSSSKTGVSNVRNAVFSFY